MGSDATFVDKNVECRKAHKCAWCGEEIPKGDIAHYYKGIWQGDFHNWHMHLECWDAWCGDYEYHEDGFDTYEMRRGSALHKWEEG